jgi:hypothetical protein
MQKGISWTGLALLVLLMGVWVGPAQSQRPAQRGLAVPIAAASPGESELAQGDAKTESAEALAEWRMVPLEDQGVFFWRPPAYKSRIYNDPINVYFVGVLEMGGEMRTFEYSGTNPADALQHLEADLGIAVAESLPREQSVEEWAPSIQGGVPGYWSETLESSAANLGILTQLIELNDCKVVTHAASPDAQGAGGAVGAAGTTQAGLLGKVICVRSTPWSPWVGGPVNVRSIPIGGGGVNCLWSQSWTRSATFSCGRIVCGLQVWSWDEVRTQKHLETVSSVHLPPYTCPALPPGGMPTP